MAAMGLGDGHHYIGQMQVLVEGRRAQVVGTNTLAGSIATMDDCVRHFIKEAGGCVSLLREKEDGDGQRLFCASLVSSPFPYLFIHLSICFYFCFCTLSFTPLYTF